MSVLLQLMNNRFQSKGYRGLHLVVGLLIFGALTLTLREIAADVINGEPLTLFDAQLSAWLYTHRSPPLTTVLLIVTSLGSAVTASWLAVVAGLYLLWRRQPYWLAAVWLSVFGGMLLNWLLKYTFHRPRPHFDDPILALTSYSFPSGHTMTATVLYGVLAALLVTKTTRRSCRALIILSASFLIALVGFSRIYLGAHYLSDVLGALAEGIAWLTLCLSAVYSLWRQQNPQRDQS